MRTLLVINGAYITTLVNMTNPTITNMMGNTDKKLGLSCAKLMLSLTNWHKKGRDKKENYSASK